MCHWYESRGLPIIPEDSLPTFGLIVPKVAAGFLIVCDCNLGLLEFYISNPESSEHERGVALDEITQGLIKYGKAIGITNFKADTQNWSVRHRAEKHGFKFIGDFSNMFLKV